MALRADDVDLGRDRALVEQCQEGDRAAFEDLYRRYYARLFRFCLRRMGDHHEAEEVTQEAFARAYRAMPALRGERRFYPWLSVIATRLCIDTHRRLGRTEPSAEIDLGPADVHPDRLEAAVDFELLSEALARLSPRHREVLELREREGWSYQRIAEYYGITLGAVEGLLFRARQALRREFNAVSGPEFGRAGAIPPVVGMGWLGRRLLGWRTRASQWAASLANMSAIAVNGLGVAMVVTTAAGLYSAAVGVSVPKPVHVATMTPAAYASEIGSAASSAANTASHAARSHSSTTTAPVNPARPDLGASLNGIRKRVEPFDSKTNVYVNNPEVNERASDNPLTTATPGGNIVAGLDPAGMATSTMTHTKDYVENEKENPS